MIHVVIVDDHALVRAGLTAVFEKTDDMRRMLEINIEMEAADVENYKQHAELAAELGMIDVQLQLEDMAADEAGHRREMERILKGM